MAHALIVFAKAPEPGRVKTRLTAVLTPAEAADLYRAFLQDALEAYATLGADVRLYVASEGRAFPDELVPAGATVRPQVGGGLGARMQHAFLDTFAAGYHEAVIIGTDHPTLPLAFVDAAFDALAEPLALTIGPSEDGGYYLLGMNDFYPEVFAEMTYSHPEVFEQTLRRAEATRAQLTVLPPWYDVDTPDDLRRLLDDLATSDAGLAHTRAALDGLYLEPRVRAPR